MRAAERNGLKEAGAEACTTSSVTLRSFFGRQNISQPGERVISESARMDIMRERREKRRKTVTQTTVQHELRELRLTGAALAQVGQHAHHPGGHYGQSQSVLCKSEK
jgi:hypothetical protein